MGPLFTFMLISFLDIFDNTIGDMLHEISVVENDRLIVSLKGKKKLIQNNFISLLSSLTDGVDGKIYIVVHNPKKNFENALDRIWIDQREFIDMYYSLKVYLEKNLKKLSMSSSHVYSLIGLNEVEYDDAICTINSAMASMAISTTEPIFLDRQLFMRRSLKEIKLNKERQAIEDYIVSKIPL